MIFDFDIPIITKYCMKTIMAMLLIAASLAGCSVPNSGKAVPNDKHHTAEPATMRDAKRILARFYAYFGTDLKDDFYTAVNQQKLSTIEIPEGEETAGGSASVTVREEGTFVLVQVEDTGSLFKLLIPKHMD